MELTDYENKLLHGWEDVHKKGQLTLWVLLALKDGPKYMANIKRFISTATSGTLEADDQSMYRALRRYYDAEMVDYQEKPGKNGPDRKVYSLTSTGSHVLSGFVRRNITNVYFNKTISQLLIETARANA